MKLFAISFQLVLLSLHWSQLLVQCGKQYKGYKVLTINNLTNETQYSAVVGLRKQGVDFWSGPSRQQPTDLMVAPDRQQSIEQYLNSSEINFQVSISDVQSLLDIETSERNNTSNRYGSADQGMNWYEYQRLSVIHSWIDYIGSYYPSIARVESIGRSFEGRDLKVIKLSANPFRNNPIIYIDGGTHAREWISVSTATYIIGRLIQFDRRDREIFHNIDWYFLPVANPDGYEFSHTDDRLWRKSRAIHNGNECIGVDLNRNYAFHWGEFGGEALDPCQETYQGPLPLSEPESSSNARFMNLYRTRIKSYLTLHSFSQLFLTPYAYTKQLTPDYPELESLGRRAAQTLKNVHGTKYGVGPSSHILYGSTGSSRDWARGVPKIKYSYTIELRDKGKRGFILPSNQILPTGEETWEAVRVIAEQVIAESRGA